jgi:hypothetical protein
VEPTAAAERASGTKPWAARSNKRDKRRAARLARVSAVLVARNAAARARKRSGRRGRAGGGGDAAEGGVRGDAPATTPPSCSSSSRRGFDRSLAARTGRPIERLGDHQTADEGMCGG